MSFPARLAALLVLFATLAGAAGCASTSRRPAEPAPPAQEPPQAAGETPPAAEEPPSGEPRAFDFERAAPRRLDAPPFAAYRSARAQAGPVEPPRLTQLSSTPNAITDVEAWFARHGLSLPLYELPADVPQPARPDAGPLPAHVPASFRGERLLRAIRQPDRTLLIYGPEYTGRYLVVLDDHDIRYALDFDAYGAPAGSDGPRQGLEWAVELDGRLFVATAHDTYARDSEGRTGFVTALDPLTGEILWQSRPLVQNAYNFDVVGGALLTGYGFTAEPDFLFLLHPDTGDVLSRIPVKTAPEYFVRRGDRLYVRTYDTDYLYAID